MSLLDVLVSNIGGYHLDPRVFSIRISFSVLLFSYAILEIYRSVPP